MRSPLPLIGFLAFVIFAAALTEAYCEHEPENADLPLVKASAPREPAHQLFAPCPLEPRNFRPYQERSA